MAIIELGTVSAPSGILLIVDPGYLGLWCHDRDIVFSESYGDKTAAAANSAVDLTIVGSDADEVGRLLDRQWHPTFLFDIPRAGIEAISLKVAEISAARSLDAHLEILGERVKHRRRVDLALTHGKGAGEVSFHGIWSAVAGDVPPGPLPVTGELMPVGEADEGRLRRVVVVARQTPAVRSERVGYVAVDWARLLVIDANAVGEWQHDEPLDGKADFAFWGRDAAEIAARVDASKLEERVYGWRDLPLTEAAARASEIETLKTREQRKFATDFRPHSHHHELMEQVRGRETESGVVRLGEAVACGFMTRWGDGIFEVHRDLDAEGRLVSLRIELGSEERQKLMRRLELRWSTSALVSRKIVDDGEPVRFMYRQTPDRAEDSGWRMMSGFEDDAYRDRPENIAVVRLSEIGDRDKRVNALLDEPVGSVFERLPGRDDFERVTDWQPPED
jgi:hypothetical protein